MSTQRLFLISFIFVGIIILAGWGILRVQYYESAGQIFQHLSADSSKSPAVRLHRRSGRFILIDTEIFVRKNSRGRMVYNPLLLTEDRLLHLGEGGTHNNPWLAFQGLYLDYYSSFYCRRFKNCELQRFDREVQLAYEFWRENRP